MDCSLPGSLVHGILQVRILEWVAIPSTRGSSQPRDRTCVSYISCFGRQVLYASATWVSTYPNASCRGKNDTLAWKSRVYGSANCIISASGQHSCQRVSPGPIWGHRKWWKLSWSLWRSTPVRTDWWQPKWESQEETECYGGKVILGMMTFIQQICMPTRSWEPSSCPQYTQASGEDWHLHRSCNIKRWGNLSPCVQDTARGSVIEGIREASDWVTYWNKPEGGVGEYCRHVGL